MQNYTCAMCGDSAGGTAPYGGYSVPAEGIELMDGTADVDPEEIAGKIRVDLCEECYEISKRMAMDHETSPLPEFDAGAVRYDEVATMAAQAGQDPDAVRDDGVTQRVVEDALATVRMDQQGQTEHVTESSITEAWVIVLSMRDLGIIDDIP